MTNSLGIPKDSIVKYESAVAGAFLVVAHRTAEEVEKAKAVLDHTEGVEATGHVQSLRVLQAAAHLMQ